LAWEDRACRRSCPRRGEDTFRVKKTVRHPKITVSADGRGVVSQAGALLLLEAAQVSRAGSSPVRWAGPVVRPAGGARPGEDPHRRGHGLR